MGQIRRRKSSCREPKRVLWSLETMHLPEHWQFRLRQLRQVRHQIEIIKIKLFQNLQFFILSWNKRSNVDAAAFIRHAYVSIYS